MSEADLDAFGLPADDDRRQRPAAGQPALRRAEPLLRTTLLPGPARGAAPQRRPRDCTDVALFEIGPVVPARPGAAARCRRARRSTGGPPTTEIAALDAALPAQPVRVAVVLAGARELPGWWGPGRPAVWADAVEAARLVARQARRRGDGARRRARAVAPGPVRRAAARRATSSATPASCTRGWSRRSACRSAPARWRSTSTLLGADTEPGPGAPLSTYPAATQDVALVVDDAGRRRRRRGGAARRGRRAARVGAAVRRLPRRRRSGAGRESLAYALRFRAPDRTLTAEETSAARDAAVAEAARRTGAVQRT